MHFHVDFLVPLKSSECNVQIMNALLKPAPAIPPTYVYLDCFDMTPTGKIVGRPMSVALKNRGGPHSLCDAVFQVIMQRRKLKSNEIF